jgi:hypothetical protein
MAVANDVLGNPEASTLDACVSFRWLLRWRSLTVRRGERAIF